MKRILIVAMALAAAACIRGGEPTTGNDLYIRVDSVRHVACYRIRYSHGVSCVTLDSTNSRAVR